MSESGPNIFSRAHDAYLQKHRPFKTPGRSSNAPQQLNTSQQSNAADYDPYHDTRFTTEQQPKSNLTTEAINNLVEAFNREHYTLEHLTPSRIRVAYRLVRNIAAVTRAVRSDETLREATGLATYDEKGQPVDPWTCPRSLPDSIDLAAMIEERNDPHSEAPDYRHVQALADLRRTNPDACTMSLLPPPPPRRYVNKQTGNILPQYDPSNPNHDMPLTVYMGALRSIYSSLGIGNGSYREPYYGTNGWAGIGDAHSIRAAFPTKLQIMDFESILISDALNFLRDKGVIGCTKELQAEYGFSKRECNWIISMARSEAGQIVSVDPTTEKNIMILRLEDLMERARTSYDVRAEINAYKLLCDVLGVKQAEGGDLHSDAAKLIRDWNTKNPQASTQRAPVPVEVMNTLPPPGITPTAPKD